VRKLLGTLVLVAGVLGGCGSQAAPPAAPAAPVSAFNPTDVAWLQLMIPMDEQLLRVLGLARDRSVDPAVRRLAAELTVSHQAELAQLVALRDRAGAPTANVHQGHDMPGMMTEDEVIALGGLRGAAFDRALRAEVTDHLAQSLVVTRGCVSAGHEPAVKQLATGIEKTRTLQTAQLSRWRPATPRTAG
jgi:uncharacterized protein (DUF305 family)